MNFLSWNIIGLHLLRKKRILKRKIEVEKPSVVMIEETKCSKSHLKQEEKIIWKRIQFVAVDVEGSTGGVAIWWNPLEASLYNLITSRLIISVKFHVIGTSIRGLISNVYGPY